MKSAFDYLVMILPLILEDLEKIKAKGGEVFVSAVKDDLKNDVLVIGIRINGVEIKTEKGGIYLNGQSLDDLLEKAIRERGGR
jgi:uncharacterized membrane protein (Fun14 family)